MSALLGTEYADFLRALDAPPAKGLRVNTNKARSGWLPQFALTPVPWAEHGYYYGENERPGRSWMHEAGLYYLQEPSAMCVASILDPRPGERVLDLCAAPGGKTTHAASLMQNRGLIVANEINPARARVLAENVRRTGCVNTAVVNEHPARLAERWAGYFDAVIVDAPCSGEGMFRKNGDAGAEWSEAGVKACAARQAQILDSAAELVRGGGRIVYSTCTFAPEENEANVAAFLKRRPDFQAVRVTREGLSEGFEPAPEAARIFPHRARGEGHFAALLGRDDAPAPIKVKPAGFASPDRRRLADYAKFAAEVGLQAPQERLSAWGDTLYAAAAAPDLAGVKTLLPGLELGQFRKGRFEPAHALALALSADAARSAAFEAIDAARYYAGEALPTDAESGWALAVADGYTLGWVKISDGLAKNRLPKALRKPNCGD